MSILFSKINEAFRLDDNREQNSEMRLSWRQSKSGRKLKKRRKQQFQQSYILESTTHKSSPKPADIQITAGNYEGEDLTNNKSWRKCQEVKEVSTKVAEKAFELVIPFLEERKEMIQAFHIVDIFVVPHCFPLFLNCGGLLFVSLLHNLGFYHDTIVVWSLFLVPMWVLLFVQGSTFVCVRCCLCDTYDVLVIVGCAMLLLFCLILLFWALLFMQHS